MQKHGRNGRERSAGRNATPAQPNFQLANGRWVEQRMTKIGVTEKCGTKGIRYSSIKGTAMNQLYIRPSAHLTRQTSPSGKTSIHDRKRQSTPQAAYSPPKNHLTGLADRIHRSRRVGLGSLATYAIALKTRFHGQCDGFWRCITGNAGVSECRTEHRRFFGE